MSQFLRIILNFITQQKYKILILRNNKIIKKISQFNNKKQQMFNKKQPETLYHSDSFLTTTQKECQNCKQVGLSNQKLTKIHHFKDILVVQFNCAKCGFKQNHHQFKEKANDFGIHILFKLQHADDKARTVIHSQLATVQVQQLDVELQNTITMKITTIQGLVQRIIIQLKQKIKSLPQNQKEIIQKIQKKLQKAQNALEGKHLPLTIKIRDPSGNSDIQNINHPLPDKNIQVFYFQRTVEELVAIGFSKQQAQKQVLKAQQSKKGIKLNFNKPFQEDDFMNKQPVIFQVPCHSCMMPGQMKLCETSIPYFTDLVIMSFNCEYCGAHSVETKNSGQVHQDALQITLKVDTDQDLKRDLFKSQTCKVCIPEAELQLDFGTLGGQYTTVEGLLQKIHDHLGGNNPFIDSDQQFAIRMRELLLDLMCMRKGNKSFTLTLIDPLSRSFLQNPYHPEQDKKAKRVSRKRNQQEDDYLGFTGMQTQNYS